MSAIMCAACGTTTTDRRDRRPWCTPCGIWLVLDPSTGDWVSHAERAHRAKVARDTLEIDQSRRAVAAAIGHARTLVPAGWRAQARQARPDVCHAIDIHPPAGAVDVTAYLLPAGSDRGWHVQIHNRTRRVGFPLYTRGGAEAAYYATVDDAVTAAVTALRIEIPEPAGGRP
jgi:hypothetical protein